MAQGNNFGIGLPAAIDADNVVESNTIMGNANGIFMANGVHGNTFRGNLILGNPPVQVSNDHTAAGGFDIKNLGPDDGTNTFDGNICMSAMNAPCPAVSRHPDAAMESELQFAACATRPPAESCRLNAGEWSRRLAAVDPKASPALGVDTGARQMTARQYLEARAAGGVGK